jgi:SAM-dependent methyltransferase
MRPGDRELEAHYGGYGDWPDSQLTRSRYRELLGGFERYRAGGRMFELGCGAGYFLEEAVAAGWEPHGSTVGELSIGLCREKGLHVVDAADTAVFPDRHFDVAAAFEVMEHLRDPESEARLLARTVRPGGLLYCTTPNFDSLARRLLGAEWRVVDYPEHLVYFTASTLAGWLGRHGFRLLEVRSTGLSPAELKSGLSGRIKWRQGAAIPAARVGMDERLREAAEGGRLAPVAKQTVNAALTRTGLGDTLKASFVRLPD